VITLKNALITGGTRGIGYFIALKGKDGDNELETSKNAMKILNV